MANLPTVGGDSGNWGTILNTYLEVEHNADGTHSIDAGSVSYTPSANADWNASADPGAAADGLDQLASRVKTVEGSITGYVPKTLFNAQTILAATADDTPAAVTVAEASTVGRQTGGNIAAIGQVSAGEKTAGTETALRSFSPADVAGMAATHGAAAGSLILLEQHTAANSATLDFTTSISATYDEYMIDFVGIVPVSTNVSFQMRMSTDGGSTYDTGSNYKYLIIYNGIADGVTGAQSNAAAAIDLTHSTSTQANFSTNGSIRLINPGSAYYKPINGAIQSVVGAGSMYIWNCTGMYTSTTAVNAFQFFFSTGNISSGTIRCYGIAKA